MTKINVEILDFLRHKSSFYIDVKTNQKKTDLILFENKIIVLIKEKPENNKANEEIEKFLSKILECDAKIISGKISKKKMIKLTKK